MALFKKLIVNFLKVQRVGPNSSNNELPHLPRSSSINQGIGPIPSPLLAKPYKMI